MSKKAMFFNTLGFIIVSIIAIFIFGTIFYLYISPSTKMTFFMEEKFNERFSQSAKWYVNKTNTSLERNPFLKAVVEENESKLVKEVRDMNENNALFWVFLTFSAFVLIILFYEGMKERRNKPYAYA